jgi:hypothetical protein
VNQFQGNGENRTDARRAKSGVRTIAPRSGSLGRRREAARSAILYAFDLIEYDGEDLRNLPFLAERRRWRGCCARPRPASCSNEHLGRPYRLRACLPARCRGYRFEEGRWHVSIWPVSRLDQSPQSRQHRGAVGAQRELESASLRQCAPTMTRHAITPRSSTH